MPNGALGDCWDSTIIPHCDRFSFSYPSEPAIIDGIPARIAPHHGLPPSLRVLICKSFTLLTEYFLLINIHSNHPSKPLLHIFYSPQFSPKMASETRTRRPSTSAPISELRGPVGPGFSRPKHKRTVTGFSAGEIKNVENSIPHEQRDASVVHFPPLSADFPR